MAYTGSVDLISGIRPKNNGAFPLVDAKDVYVSDDKRLDAALNEKMPAADALPKPEAEGAEGQFLKNGADGATAWGDVTAEEVKVSDTKNLDEVLAEKADADDVIPKPAVDGTEGQHLEIDANGAPVWLNPGTPTDTQVGEAVDAWLTAHPEATTTVQDGTITRAKLDADLQQKTDEVGELKSAFGDITETTTEEITEPVQYTESAGYYTKAGQKFTGGSYDDYRYTDILPVNPGDVITLTFRTSSTNLRVLTAYSNGDAVTEDGRENTRDPYTVPDGINGIRLTYYLNAVTGATKTYTQTTFGVKGLPELAEQIDGIDERVTALEEATTARHITNGMVYAFDINSDNHELNDTNTLVEDMFGYSIQFDGRVTTFNGLTLGHGNGIPYGGYVKITPTHFEYYLGAEANPRLSETHNLTIADYISVRIDAKPSTKADFTIYTNGGVYTKNNQAWDVRAGRLFVNSNGINVLTECTFAYMCRGWDEKVHLYGDSYFGVYNDKWTNYLTTNNWNKCNLNAYPGRASAEALRVAKNVLNHSNPEMIVWCLGMNDGDDGGVVDASWKACVDELMEICTDRGIELILATIPNVPTVDNTAKNAYVRASGHRYIDFASAVGASSGTTWFSGMLSNDGVHPATQGAIALFNQAIADVPELMQ